ncbi:MAG: hypothetical protein WBA16_08935 [Nonlabens sp.]
MNGDQSAMQLWGKQYKQKPKWTSRNNAITIVKEVPYRVLQPNRSISFKGEKLTTNSQGLRDKEYLLDKNSNTYRYLLLGGSYEMGSGVANNQTYENLTEVSLNNSGRKVEILNTALGGYHIVENVSIAKKSIPKFVPDAIIYTAHTEEYERAIAKVVQLIKKQAIITDIELSEIIKRSGAKHNMSRLEVEHRLRPYRKDILKWGYQSIYDAAKEGNAKSIWLFLPALGDLVNVNELDELKSLAIDIGFEIIVLEDMYKGYSTEELSIAPWDMHPNAEGHQLIAKQLIEKLSQNLLDTR